MYQEYMRIMFLYKHSLESRGWIKLWVIVDDCFPYNISWPVTQISRDLLQTSNKTGITLTGTPTHHVTESRWNISHADSQIWSPKLIGLTSPQKVPTKAMTAYVCFIVTTLSVEGMTMGLDDQRSIISSYRDCPFRPLRELSNVLVVGAKCYMGCISKWLATGWKIVVRFLREGGRRNCSLHRHSRLVLGSVVW
jgi:hypothetical protein